MTGDHLATAGASAGSMFFWAALALTVLGATLVVRCIARGHAARDLRSLCIGLAMLVVAGALWIAAPRPPASSADALASSSGPPIPAAVQAVLRKHCYACHASQTRRVRSPWAFNLDQPGTINRMSAPIYRQVVELRAMPLGNATQMTEGDRQVIARWHEAIKRERGP